MKTALVTGAASGIGFAVSRGLYSLGWRVLMVDKTLEECRRAAEDVASFSGGEVLPFGCDLADLAALSDCIPDIKAILDKHCNGQLDALIANAGAFYTGVSACKAHLNLHCLSPMLMIDHLMPMLVKASGRIIFTGCSALPYYKQQDPTCLFKGDMGSLRSYALSKTGAAQLCFALKNECANISFYVADPGLVYSDLFLRNTRGFARKALRLVRRFGISSGKAASTALCLCQSQSPEEGFYYKNRKEAPVSTLPFTLKKAQSFLCLCREHIRNS